MRPVSLYVHVPFCRRRCPYCTFYHVADADGEVERRFVEGLVCELRRGVADIGGPLRIPTVYFGGGTPSVLDRESLETIIGEISPHLASDPVEITLETNPEDVSEPMAKRLCEIGVNRLSLGIQSMSVRAQNVLQRCAPRVNERAVQIARRFFNNINLDFLLGVPGGTRGELEEWLAAVDRFEPQHVSVYCLEPGGVVPPQAEVFFGDVDPEQAADEYLLVCDRLRSRGYRHYEVSNFALPGFESRHNQVYWSGGEYLGIGPSAHSFIEGERYFNVPSIEKYIDGPLRSLESIRQHEVRGEAERRLEEIMLALRTSAGVPLDRLTCDSSVIDRLAEEHLADVANDSVVLTDRGFLVLNEIVHRLSGGP